MGVFTKRTPKMRAAILKALRDGRGYGGAAAAVGISRRHFEIWRKDDPAWAKGDPNAPPIATAEMMRAMIYPRPELERDLLPLIDAEAEDVSEEDDAAA
jgi:hypothetical protein